MEFHGFGFGDFFLLLFGLGGNNKFPHKIEKKKKRKLEQSQNKFVFFGR